MVDKSSNNTKVQSESLLNPSQRLTNHDHHPPRQSDPYGNVSEEYESEIDIEDRSPVKLDDLQSV